MIVYNTTFHIEKDCVEACLDYLKKEYIPCAMADGSLQQPCLRRVLFVQDEGESYALQFHVDDVDTLNDWLEKEGHAMHKLLTDRFGHQVAGFTTLLEELDWEV